MALHQETRVRLRAAKTDEIRQVWDARYRGRIVCLKTLYGPDDVDGLALTDAHDEVVALATFHIDGPSGQVVTLDALMHGHGYGQRLLESLESKFHDQGLGRAWALMTNDNLNALSLYLSRGYRLVRVHLDALDRVREYKPDLPLKGRGGIVMRDLWELEKVGLLGVPVP